MDGGGAGAGALVSRFGSSGGGGTALENIRFIGGQQVTIIVGAGGASNAKGTNSRFGDVIAEGGGFGGRGAAGNLAGGDGGSGGGAGSDSTPGSGTSNQGFNGGTGALGNNYPSTFTAGGGGGAGENGNTDGQSAGGDGITNSITGTSAFYAGGGGGAVGGAATLGSGGDGGGGVGSRNSRNGAQVNAGNGVENTGGGGGGGSYYDVSGIGFFNQPAGSGGRGIVILRYPSGARIIDRIDPGLVYEFTDDGTFKRYVFKSGAGNIIF